jgi:sulfur carrier protein
MKLTVNGAECEVEAATTVAALVAEHARTTRGVAVAVDGEVVCRSRWEVCTLYEGAKVEILSAAPGG